MKKIIFFFIASISIISCTEQQTNRFDANDSNKSCLKFELFGDGCDNRFTILLNVPTSEDTLIIYKCSNAYTNSCDSNKISITKIDQDSLYAYFKDAVNKFKINKLGQNKTGIAIRLSVFSKDKSISISYLSLEQHLRKNNSDEITQIVNFLNRRIDRKFQINY
ncbi:MAG: hypothetical protein ABI199_00215 [Bacteroidia bacterium]